MLERPNNEIKPLLGLFLESGVHADKRLSEEARATLREAIRDAEGMEVLALGEINASGIIADLRIYTRGHETAVIAPRNLWEAADVLIHNHPSGQLTPSDEDLEIAAANAEAGIGFYIVDNAVARVYVVAEAISKSRQVPLNADELAAALETGGLIAKRLTHYESRKSQLELIRWIAKAFNENRILAAEAGTGVGKSFAYLIPAMLWANSNKDRVVISTATINLQQQLFDKDIPLIASALESPIKAVLLKGRSNYLCRRRLNDLVLEAGLFRETIDRIDELLAWVEASPDGTRSDLPFSAEEAIWSRICSEADNCLGLNCVERERCFFQKIKRQAADSQILVVNHHLLFADLAARASGAGYSGTVVLPFADRIILDEAHTISEAATSFFSQGFSRIGSLKQLNHLWRHRRGMETGLLIRLKAYLTDWPECERTIAAITDIKSIFQDLDASAADCLGDQNTFRIAPQLDSTALSPLLSNFNRLHARISQFIDLIRSALERIPDSLSSESLLWEIKTAIRRLETIAGACSHFTIYQELTDKVCWMERRWNGEDSAWIGFYISPLDVATSLQSALFTPSKSVVAVSATLTVAGSFSFWLNRCGARSKNGDESITIALPSPFPYHNNVLFAVPQDAPLPDESDYQEFLETMVLNLLQAAGGSALVLFTSYAALRSAYDAIKPVLSDAGILVLKQGDDDRARLLKTFLADRSSVLFGTDSFWEGIDAPGETLRLVVICRLPFRSPNEPIYEARRESIEKRGGNSFIELSLPEAVMKFKQGFGRLIRRSSDRGAVVVLDSRVIKKRYGGQFLSSLPETKTMFKSSNEICLEVDRFLNRMTD